MPVKRKLSKQLQHRITPEVMAAYRAGDHWELQRALHLKPWVMSPLGCDLINTVPGTAYANSLEQARALRDAIEAQLETAP